MSLFFAVAICCFISSAATGTATGGRGSKKPGGSQSRFSPPYIRNNGDKSETRADDYGGSDETGNTMLSKSGSGGRIELVTRQARRRHGQMKRGLENENFVTSKQIGVSLLSGCGVYVGFKIADWVERHLLHRHKKGSVTSSGSGTVSIKMYNELKSELEELWRITHQIYTELEKIGSLSNSTDATLNRALNRLKSIEDMTSLRAETDGGEGDMNFRKLCSELEQRLGEETALLAEAIEVLRNEELPEMLHSHEKALTTKVSAYVEQIKSLIKSKEKLRRSNLTQTVDGLESREMQRSSSLSSSGEKKSSKRH